MFGGASDDCIYQAYNEVLEMMFHGMKHDSSDNLLSILYSTMMIDIHRGEINLSESVLRNIDDADDASQKIIDKYCDAIRSVHKELAYRCCGAASDEIEELNGSDNFINFICMFLFIENTHIWAKYSPNPEAEIQKFNNVGKCKLSECNTDVYFQENFKIVKDVESNSDKPWDWHMLSINPGLTAQDIIDHPNHPWTWDGISENLFSYSMILQEFATKKLKHALVGVRAKRLIRQKKVFHHTELCNDLINLILGHLRSP